jgi:hypothetical protein
MALLLLRVIDQRQIRAQPWPSLAASIRTECRCLFLCLEMGMPSVFIELRAGNDSGSPIVCTGAVAVGPVASGSYS